MNCKKRCFDIKSKRMMVSMFILCALIIIFMTDGIIRANGLVAGEAQEFVLSPQEQAYLESLKDRPIVIAYSYDLILAMFDGVSYGMLNPVLDILKDKFGLTIQLVKTNWQEAFEQVESGEVDFYGPIVISEERKQRYITVDPFYHSHSKIITRMDSPIHSMIGLQNKTIGLLNGSVASRTMRMYLGTKGKVTYFPTMEDMLMGLSTGVIDAIATVDNAEFEIFRHDNLQLEFTIDNFFVVQGLISDSEEMRLLAELLSRYIMNNPNVYAEIIDLRKKALLMNARKRLADEIAFISQNYSEIEIYSPTTLYPLSYKEDGVMKGMMAEIIETFEELTGVNVRLATAADYAGGLVEAMERLRAGQCKAFVGFYLSLDLMNDPVVEFSKLLWHDTIRTYSYRDISDDLRGKTLGIIPVVSDYLGWNNTTGNLPVRYIIQNDMLRALKSGEIDAAFMSEMGFNYNHSVLRDFGLREIMGLTAQAPMFLLYGAMNKEFNAIFDEAIVQYHVINPLSLRYWQSQNDRYKNDFIRLRHTQQVWTSVAIIVFAIMLLLMIFLLWRVRVSFLSAKKKNYELGQANEIILSNVNYSNKIQSNLLPSVQTFDAVFGDHSVIWKPRDIVGGDIYWLKQFEGGAVLCVCDCTGHGVSGAMLTMLVVSAFDAIITDKNYNDTADIVYMLDKRIATILNVDSDRCCMDIKDGCDLAVLYIANDGCITMSSGNMIVFTCDGQSVTQYKGQSIFVGEGRLESKDEVKTVTIPAHINNKYYIASDGLSSQIGDEQNKMFGYQAFENIILKNHNEKQSVISDKIWDAFEKHRGKQPRRDDVELITFKPRAVD
jgi:ABC-type amino acid transport substrate-binding protein